VRRAGWKGFAEEISRAAGGFEGFAVAIGVGGGGRGGERGKGLELGEDLLDGGGGAVGGATVNDGFGVVEGGGDVGEEEVVEEAFDGEAD
jgi:hypothetical protein